jgi:ribosomal protein S18 acetylase RimI-like enzyme
MTFDCKLTSRVATRDHEGSGSIRPSTHADIPALRTIAAANHTDSRFYADGRFARAKCDELYATWIEKSCRGWADVVFVAELDGAPVGYLSCHMKPAKTGSIGLVGLAAHAQGRGLGRRLVAAGVDWFHGRGAERATVVTQGCNVAAQHLYQSCGFRTASVQLWHHLWFNSSRTTRS